MTPDQVAALHEIVGHLDELILEARAATLDALAACLEDVRAEAS
jgi:hypothetical protein